MKKTLFLAIFAMLMVFGADICVAATTPPTSVNQLSPIVRELKWGDTLTHLAGDYGLAVDDLMKANVGNPAVTDKDTIFAGQFIRIPVYRAVAVEAMQKEHEKKLAIETARREKAETEKNYYEGVALVSAIIIVIAVLGAGLILCLSRRNGEESRFREKLNKANKETGEAVAHFAELEKAFLEKKELARKLSEDFDNARKRTIGLEAELSAVNASYGRLNAELDMQRAMKNKALENADKLEKELEREKAKVAGLESILGAEKSASDGFQKTIQWLQQRITDFEENLKNSALNGERAPIPGEMVEIQTRENGTIKMRVLRTELNAKGQIDVFVECSADPTCPANLNKDLKKEKAAGHIFGVHSQKDTSWLNS